MPLMPELKKLRQGDEELEVNLGYTVRPCLKRKCGKGGRKRRGGKEEKERS